MLALRPNCKRCNMDLSPDSLLARICSFECTFCQSCTDDAMRGVCPNCGGELLRRPVRPAHALAKHPASTERVFKPDARP